MKRQSSATTRDSEEKGGLYMLDLAHQISLGIENTIQRHPQTVLQTVKSLQCPNSELELVEGVSVVPPVLLRLCECGLMV
jgi:hypothetical protein